MDEGSDSNEGLDSNGIVETIGGTMSPDAWAEALIEVIQCPMLDISTETINDVLSPIENTTIDEEKDPEEEATAWRQM